MTDPKRVFYHATWCGNVESIKQKGLIPRTKEEAERMLDAILAEYGYTRDDLPKWRWLYALERLKETAGVVYLSADPMYSFQNCLAGFEAEAELRGNIESFKKHRKMRYITVEEVAVKKGPDASCAICEVAVDDAEIQEMPRLKENWERMSADHRKKLGLETFEDYLQWLQAQGLSITVKGQIPADKVKECHCISGVSPHLAISLDKSVYAQTALRVYEQLGVEIPPKRRERYEEYLKGVKR